MLNRSWTSSLVIWEVGTPSILMLPLLISKNRISRFTIVVLPAPVGPVMPMRFMDGFASVVQYSISRSGFVMYL